MLLKGKNAIITGASRGIGKGIATMFAQNGANVAFTYSSSSDAAKSLEKELTSYGTNIKSYQSNAASFDDSQKLIDNVLEDFGSIDILINNAGITKDNLLMRMQESDLI
jgi:3-oxoacyl-[acyl-carrier protein] reductase